MNIFLCMHNDAKMFYVFCIYFSIKNHKEQSKYGEKDTAQQPNIKNCQKFYDLLLFCILLVFRL